MGIDIRFILSICDTFCDGDVCGAKVFFFSVLLKALYFTVVTGEAILQDCDRTSKPLTEFHQIAMVIHRLSAHMLN